MSDVSLRSIEGYEDLAALYNSGEIRGIPPIEACRELGSEIIGRGIGNFVSYRSIAPAGRTGHSSNWQVMRKINGGKDFPNINQATGDCVSWGCRNAALVTGCNDVAVRGENETVDDPFPPYIFGAARVLIGRNPWGYGAVPAYAAAALTKYGVIYFDTPGTPEYSKSVAVGWGRSGPPSGLIPIGQKQPIKSVVPLGNDPDKAFEYCIEGYGITLAASWGYTYQPDSEGFHTPDGSWDHQMCLLDVDLDWKIPYVLIMNSWADVFGHLIDFRTGLPLPKGIIRVRLSDFLRHARVAEMYALCQYDQPKAQDINEALYKGW